MGILEDIWRAITSPPGSPDPILSPETIPTPEERYEQVKETIQETKETLGLEPSEATPESVARAKRFLQAEALLLGAIVGAPAGYALYTSLGGKKRQSALQRRREERIFDELGNASTRATTMLSAFGPSIAIPATYITVQELENALYITKGLGDAVQGLLTASASAGLVGGIAGLATALVKKGK